MTASPGATDPFGRRGADPATLPPEVQGLLEDVAAMARAIVEDGLTMETLMSDLRLLCDLEEGERLPLDVLRVATLAWSDHHGELERRSTQRDGGLVAPDDLVWALVGRDDRPPGSPHEVVVLRAPASSDLGALLGDVAREVFAAPDDLVALLADDRAVVLPAPGDDAGAPDAAARAAVAVRALRGASGPEAEVAVVPLASASSAAAAALRRLLADLDGDLGPGGAVSPPPAAPPPPR